MSKQVGGYFHVPVKHGTNLIVAFTRTDLLSQDTSKKDYGGKHIVQGANVAFREVGMYMCTLYVHVWWKDGSMFKCTYAQSRLTVQCCHTGNMRMSWNVVCTVLADDLLTLGALHAMFRQGEYNAATLYC